MEIGFNLAWVLLSLLLSIGWARNVSKGPGRHAHHASFLALVILIALLFPVVSISDDLHDHANITTEETRYLDDLHHHFQTARLHADHDPFALNFALAVTIPALEVVHFEEVIGHGTALIRVDAGFPPTLHDLPPPSHV